MARSVRASLRVPVVNGELTLPHSLPVGTLFHEVFLVGSLYLDLSSFLGIAALKGRKWFFLFGSDPIQRAPHGGGYGRNTALIASYRV